MSYRDSNDSRYNSSQHSGRGQGGIPQNRQQQSSSGTRYPASGSGRPPSAAGNRQSARNMPQSEQGRQPQHPQRQPAKQPQPKQKGNRWFRALIMVMATIACCIFLAFFILQSAFDLFGLNQNDQIIEVEIPQGATLGDVATILSETGIVDQAFTFRVYAGIKMTDEEIQSGKYAFNVNMGYDEIFTALKVGNNEDTTVRLIFAEGRTVSEIAGFLEEYEVCSAQEFIDYLQDCDYDYEYFNMIPNDPLRYHRLEGYMFPDTYDFYVGENVREVARKFLDNFDNKITEELREKMQEYNLTLDETIILASIIQKEAATQEDMRLVSSVFHNRRDNTAVYPRMQSDVTIIYVNDEIKPYLEQTNQEMYDAYNTYIREGLPVGAICNPGMAAIEAALNPAQSDYFFFVTDKNGEFYYAQTAQEHYSNVATAMSVGGEVHGVDTQ